MIEEQKLCNIMQLAKKLEIPLEQLIEILMNLKRHNLLEYDIETGKMMLPAWLMEIDSKIENIKPTTGAIILPKNEEVKIQDIVIGNFTKKDLELKIRLKAKLKEIAICDLI
jgi:hypothetical protein